MHVSMFSSVLLMLRLVTEKCCVYIYTSELGATLDGTRRSEAVLADGLRRAYALLLLLLLLPCHKMSDNRDFLSTFARQSRLLDKR